MTQEPCGRPEIELFIGNGNRWTPRSCISRKCNLRICMQGWLFESTPSIIPGTRQNYRIMMYRLRPARYLEICVNRSITPNPSGLVPLHAPSIYAPSPIALPPDLVDAETAAFMSPLPPMRVHASWIVRQRAHPDERL